MKFKLRVGASANGVEAGKRTPVFVEKWGQLDMASHLWRSTMFSATRADTVVDQASVLAAAVDAVLSGVRPFIH